jgi:hydroxymethylglutaryl-CoA lyase
VRTARRLRALSLLRLTLSLSQLGVPTVDSSISALGGCPYSPGATGNVSTEDVVYALESSGFSTGLLLTPGPTKRWDDLAEAGERRDAFEKLAEVGDWVSQRLGRPNGSRAGQAALKRRERREKVAQKAKL